jgi:hypothetical protein
MCSKPHKNKRLGMENDGVDIDNQSKKNENPRTKTIRNDREPLWLLTLRTTNNTMTPNIIAVKSTNVSFQKSQFYTVAILKESVNPYIRANIYFITRADSWMAEKRHTCNQNTLKCELVERFSSARKLEHNHNNIVEQ